MPAKRTESFKPHRWNINADSIRFLLSCKSIDEFVGNPTHHDQNILVNMLIACHHCDRQTRNQLIQLLIAYVQSDLIREDWKCVLGLVLSSLSILRDVQPILSDYTTQLNIHLQNTLSTKTTDLDRIVNRNIDLKQRYFKLNHMSAVVKQPYHYKSFYHHSHEFKEKQHFNVCQTFLDQRRAKIEKYTHRAKIEPSHFHQKDAAMMMTTNKIDKPPIDPVHKTTPTKSFDIVVKPRPHPKTPSNQKKTVLLDLDVDLFSKKKPGSSKSKSGTAATKNKTTPTKNVSNNTDHPSNVDNKPPTATNFNVTHFNSLYQNNFPMGATPLANRLSSTLPTHSNLQQLHSTHSSATATTATGNTVPLSTTNNRNDSKFNIPIIRVNPNLLSKLNMTHMNSNRSRVIPNKPNDATSIATNVNNINNSANNNLPSNPNMPDVRHMPQLNTISSSSTTTNTPHPSTYNNTAVNKSSSTSATTTTATGNASSTGTDKTRQDNAKEFLTVLNSAPNNVKMLVANFLKGNRDLPPEANGNPIFQVKLTESFIQRQIDPNQPAITVAIEEWVQMDYSTGFLKRFKAPRKIS